MVVANRSLEIAASIGIALFPEHGQDSIALARHADQAMYLAKQAGHNRYWLFGAGQNS